MGNRKRVLSFMSSFSNRDSRSPEPASGPAPIKTRQRTFTNESTVREPTKGESTPPQAQIYPQGTTSDSPQPRYQGGRDRAPSGSRPVSMIQTYQPPLMELTQDTIPELQPIFTFLNSHGNKLYQEGYFLKLDDQSVAGRANADRTWTECFAQLVGTVLSLWDAQELDAAGQDGEVLPKFINLTDASIKMIESLPTRSDSEAPLQNVLSISTAGKNRYLLHFNSHHSLIQWTAGIRLAMYEHATLQEAYTGALIAGKGKSLNNINIIMDRSKVRHEDWARVRFGAGTPWRRCWCVISPPDEKEVQRQQKELKKKSAYDRSRPAILKGNIKFYDTKKTKKILPIATITDAYSAFAIYPQSKPLIDASTLVKVEGNITIHSNPPSTTEGFVFVMPEVHPAVTGFEMMLRWLFPVFDTFGLYGRPGRLVADTLDSRSLMFAMPKQRRYGYLEILDVSGLILEQGSGNWREAEWRRKMKELTGRRMTAIENGSRSNSRYSSRRNTRNSFGPSRSRVAFDDGASIRSSPSMTWGHGSSENAPYGVIPRTDSAPPGATAFDPVKQSNSHQRSVSETQGYDRYQNQSPVAYEEIYEDTEPPNPPPHSGLPKLEESDLRSANKLDSTPTPDRMSSEDEQAARASPVRELQEMQATTSPEPVATPPAFAHGPGSLPISKPYHSPELRRANSRMSHATLSQLTGAGGVTAAYLPTGAPTGADEEQRRQNMGPRTEESGQGVLSDANKREFPANEDGLNEGSVVASKRFSFEDPPTPPSNSDVERGHFHQQQFPVTPPPIPTTIPFSHPINQAVSNSLSHDPRSNFISTGQSQITSVQLNPSAIGHSANSSTDSTRSQPPQPSRIQTNYSIIRKPLPSRPTVTHTPDVSTPQTASSTGSLGQHIIDQAAFDLVVPRDDNRKFTPLPETQMRRQQSNISSLYEEAESTASPDYASTVRSMDTYVSTEKPRTGVMRTVGNTELSLPGSERAGDEPSSLLPNIDFGPTINYGAERLPRNNPAIAGRTSPNKPLVTGSHSVLPNRNMISSDQGAYRMGSGEPRTVAWHPGMSAVGGISPGNQRAITPEQFVQQRAMTAPMYAHQRQQSSGSVPRSGAPTPPLVRDHRSSVLLPQKVHSRNNSSEPFQRPDSRGASAALGQSGSGDYSSHLSAREQEHLARVTGQPLINIAGNNRPNSTQVAGYVGAIEAREKEKQQMKQGLTSQTVQNAIAKRQSTGFLYSDHLATEYRAPQSQYGVSRPHSQPFSGPPQRQQTWTSPATDAYPQQWTPAPFQTPPEQPYQQPHQQYFSHSQYPQQQGRGNQGYNGK